LSVFTERERSELKVSRSSWIFLIFWYFSSCYQSPRRCHKIHWRISRKIFRSSRFISWHLRSSAERCEAWIKIPSRLPSFRNFVAASDCQWSAHNGDY
jgi:hypothetical protein